MSCYIYLHEPFQIIKLYFNCLPAGSRFAGVFWGVWLGWRFPFLHIQGTTALLEALDLLFLVLLLLLLQVKVYKFEMA